MISVNFPLPLRGITGIAAGFASGAWRELGIGGAGGLQHSLFLCRALERAYAMIAMAVGSLLGGIAGSSREPPVDWVENYGCSCRATEVDGVSQAPLQ